MALTEETKQTILNNLKKVMKKNAGKLVLKSESPTGIEYIGNTPTPYGYKKEIVPGMYFASAMIRKDSVAFYFFPCYMHEKEFNKIAPNTIKTLKGKTCFHFRKESDIHETELAEMFKKGLEYYKTQGWIK